MTMPRSPAHNQKIVVAGQVGPPRKIPLGFGSTATLKAILEKEMRHGFLTIRHSDTMPAGSKVELVFTLPECFRQIQAPAIVDRYEPDEIPGQVRLRLRFVGSGVGIPLVLDRFLSTCRGLKCSSFGANSNTKCDLVRRERKRTAPVSQEIPAATRGVKEDHHGATGPVHAEKSGKLESRPPGPASKKSSATKHKRHSSIQNLLSALGLNRSRKTRVKKTTLTGAQVMDRTRKLSGTGKEKAASLVEEASKALAAGDKTKAVNLLKVATAFDPTNIKAKALLKYAEQ